jgi:hypothetical protein
VNRRQRAEVRRVEKLVGPAGLKPLPLHVWCKSLIESGRASPELVKAAAAAKAYWDGVLPSLPVLVSEPAGQRAPAGAARRGLPKQ